MDLRENVAERLHKDFAEHMIETGRPMERFILTPAEYNDLCVEMKQHCRIWQCSPSLDAEIVMYMPGGHRVVVVKGPE